MARDGIPRGSWLYYFEIGGNLHRAEWLLIYFVFPCVVFWLTPAPLQDLFRLNAVVQALVFIPLVQIPALITSQLIYVDIGWPTGLCCVALTALTSGTGWWLRRWVASSLLLVHGARMMVGAFFMFGSASKFTFRFSADLPRYQFARVRWEKEHGMPASHWWLKVQHDTMQQGLANATLLAAPIFLAASNPTEHLAPLEVCGWLIWLGGWLFENAADVQKLLFLAECKAKGKSIRESNATDAAAKAEAVAALKQSCLGMAPFAGSKYFCWTLCRHPNYFGEWCCWLGLVVAAIPSVFAVCGVGDSGWWLVPLVGLMLAYVLRLFYDCLVWWTGAGPAEHFSGLKRPLYLEYQRTTRCFWPSVIPTLSGMHHYQEPGWPHAKQ